MTMVKWILPDGREVTADVSSYANLMAAAVNNNIPNVVGECGGCLSCATCHVYVSDDWLERIGAAHGSESDMLDVVEAPRQSGSRLSCQIPVGPALDGLVLIVPQA